MCSKAAYVRSAIGSVSLRSSSKLKQGITSGPTATTGLWHLSKANSEDDTIAQSFFRQAIDLDPTFAPGYSALALAQLQAAAIYQKLSLAEAQSSAEALARRAVSLDGPDAEARSCLGWALQARGELDGALVEIERALAMSPNLAVAHLAERRHTNLFGTAHERARSSRNLYQARSPRSVYGCALVAHCLRSLFCS